MHRTETVRAAAGPIAVASSNRVFIGELRRVDLLPWCSIAMARGRRKCLLAIIAMFLLHREWPLSGDWGDESVKESTKRRSFGGSPWWATPGQQPNCPARRKILIS